MKRNVDDQCVASSKRLVNLELCTRSPRSSRLESNDRQAQNHFEVDIKYCLEGFHLLLIVVGQITIVVKFR